MEVTYTLTFAGMRRPGPGAAPVKTYDVVSSKGTQYEVRAPNGEYPWEVATLAKTKHGCAWRWAKDITKGVAADVIKAVQDHIERVQQETATALAQITIVKVQPINAQTFPEDKAVVCFMVCALETARSMANAQVCGVTFQTAGQAFNASGVGESMRSAFMHAYVDTLKREHPGGVCVGRNGVIVASLMVPFSVRVIGVGLFA